MNRVKGAIRHDLVRRSATFAISTLASTLVGVVSIPLITAAVGAQQWGALAFLQVLGQFASIFVAFGWGATGPSIVAGLPTEHRRQYLLESMLVRGVLFLIVAPIAMLIGIVLGAEPGAVVLAVIAYALPGFGAAWYFIGTNRPMYLLLCDAVPAIAGQIAALFAVSIWPDLRAYLAAIVIFTIIGTALGLIVAYRSTPGDVKRPTLANIKHTMAVQRHGLITVLFGNIATTVPAFLVFVFANSLYPVYALADRLYRYGVIVLAPILQAVQGWVPEAGAAHTAQRAKQTLWFGLGIGAIGGLALGGLSPWAANILTHGTIEIVPLLALMCGVGFAAECVSQIVGLAGLVAIRKDAVLARSALIAALVGVPLMIPALLLWGIVGLFAVVATVACCVGGYRAFVLYRSVQTTAEVAQ